MWKESRDHLIGAGLVCFIFWNERKPKHASTKDDGKSGIALHKKVYWQAENHAM
jgi:hypothetical protein